MKAIFLAVVLALICSPSFATNATNLIGISPASTAMGGTGVANYTSTVDALYKNPAMLGYSAGEAGKIDGQALVTFIKPNITGNLNNSDVSSSAGGRFLPAIAGSYRLNDKLDFGLGAYAFGGNAVDYKGNASMFELQSENHLYRFELGASYHVCTGFTVGVAPFLSWGQLNINEDILTVQTAPSQTNRGLSGALGFGVAVGAVATPIEHVKIGVSVTTKQKMNYKQVLDIDLFGSPTTAGHALASPALDDVPLEHPMEIAGGVSYDGLDKFLFTFDYRYIGWGHADVFHDLGWNDQHVFALGGQYNMNDWKFRLGVNWSNSPIDNTVNETGANLTPLAGHMVEARRVSMFNAVLFPSYITTHITAGAGYKLSEKLGLDAAFVFVPKASISRAGAGGNVLPANLDPSQYNFTGSQSQWQVGVGATYQF